MSKVKTVSQTVKSAKPGALFSTSDFVEAGSYESVRKALLRLVESGELERPVRGLYRKPKFNSFLNRFVPASPEEIAEALAQKFEWKIAPFGSTALNMLGIDSQVPSVVCYVSDGPYRTYNYGSYAIEFRHTANRDLSKMSSVSAMVVQALKALGKDGLTPEKLEAISSRLSEAQMNDLESQTRNSTTWVREAVRVMVRMRVHYA